MKNKKFLLIFLLVIIIFSAIFTSIIVILDISPGKLFFSICCIIWIICTVFRMLTGK